MATMADLGRSTSLSTVPTMNRGLHISILEYAVICNGLATCFVSSHLTAVDIYMKMHMLHEIKVKEQK